MKNQKKKVQKIRTMSLEEYENLILRSMLNYSKAQNQLMKIDRHYKNLLLFKCFLGVDYVEVSQ